MLLQKRIYIYIVIDRIFLRKYYIGSPDKVRGKRYPKYQRNTIEISCKMLIFAL